MPPTELTGLRTANAKHFLRDDGFREGVFSPGAIHYKATPGGPWLDKRMALKAGTAAGEIYVSDESDVTMRVREVGTGGSRRWWVSFTETLTGQGIEFELNVQPSATLGSPFLTFQGGDGQWSYTHTRTGGKMLGPPTPSAVGTRTHGPFRYNLLGGAPQLAANPDGSVSCGDVFRMAAPYLIGADGGKYATSAWVLDRAAQTLTFTYSDAGLPAAAFPYRVDPSSTFAVSAGANDYKVVKDGAAYPPTNLWMDTVGTTIPTEDIWNGSTYFHTNGFVNMDTSSLPDNSTVMEARLSLYIDTRSGTRDFSMGWQTGGWTGTTADHSMTPRTTAYAPVAVNTLPASGLHEFALLNANTYISKTGSTGLSTHLGGTPAGAPTSTHNFWFVGFEHASLQEARLLVTYAIPGRNARSSASGGTGTAGASSVVVNTSGAVENDRIVARLAVSGGTAATITAPGGWNLVGSRVDSTTNLACAAYEKIAGASEPATATFTLDTTRAAAWTRVHVFEHGTVDAGQAPTIEAAAQQANASGTTVTAPQVTTTGTDRLLAMGAAALAEATLSGWTTPLVEEQDVQGYGPGTGGSADTLYMMGGTLTNGMQPMQRNGTVPTDAAFATATGWVFGATAVNNYAGFRANTERATNQWSTTVQPDTEGLITGGTGNAFRSPTAYRGTFANAAWTLKATLRSVTAAMAAAQLYAIRWRVYASVNADGTSARELTSSVLESNTVTPTANLTANHPTATVSWSPGALTLDGEYLFFVLAARTAQTAAIGPGNTRDANFRQNTNSAVVTPTFTPAVAVTLGLASGVQAASGASGAKTATLTVAGVNIGQLVAFGPPGAAPPAAEDPVVTSVVQPLAFY